MISIYLLKITIFSFFISVLAIGCLSDNDKSVEVKDKVEIIKSLVDVGMDIDEASKILRENGFKVGEKYMPTKNKDYYQVNIPVIDKIPVSSTIAESAGIETNTRGYVVLKADLDGKITAIKY
jgi:hypothetical protein